MGSSEADTVWDMNYSALIQNRKSTRDFTKKQVPASVIEAIETFYQNECQSLIPELYTELRLYSGEKRDALEGAAGYEDKMIGAPNYLVLLSEEGAYMYENAGYMMEDLILKLTELGLGSCWLTFTDSDRVKEALGIESEKVVAAIAAFGYGEKARKRIKLNILSMSNVDVKAEHHFFDPKKKMDEMVFMNEWGNSAGLDDHIGFYGDMLWEALYAATLSPSYLNRQPYGFLIQEHEISLIAQDDSYTDELDEKLGIGIVMLHFTSVAESWHAKIDWKFGEEAAKVDLPEDCRVVATCKM